MPPSFIVGRRRVWRESAIVAWLERLEREDLEHNAFPVDSTLCRKCQHIGGHAKDCA
ncbi:hypothetical protein [Gordonia iterans]